MAYFNWLAAVAERELERLRGDPMLLLHPSRVSGASHLLAYWGECQPLCGLLTEALDGGEIIHPELWHPLRVPLAQRPGAVRRLAEQIAAAVDAGAVAGDDWLAGEVGRMLGLFRHAAAADECVISALNEPADAERANRVQGLWARS